jgi:cobalamin biosynthesis Mg chelatase CobN
MTLILLCNTHNIRHLNNVSRLEYKLLIKYSFYCLIHKKGKKELAKNILIKTGYVEETKNGGYRYMKEIADESYNKFIRILSNTNLEPYNEVLFKQLEYRLESWVKDYHLLKPNDDILELKSTPSNTKERFYNNLQYIMNFSIPPKSKIDIISKLNFIPINFQAIIDTLNQK